MPESLATVVIPANNAAQYLAGMRANMRAQTILHYEAQCLRGGHLFSAARLFFDAMKLRCSGDAI